MFLESTEEQSTLSELSLSYEPAELERLQRLIQAVRKKVIALDIPDVSKYPHDLIGIKTFEEDLLNGD